MVEHFANKFNKKLSSIAGSGINTLSNNEIKDIITGIRSSENRGMLLKGTTEKIISQGGESFGNFVKFLFKFGNFGVLLALGLTTAASATDAAIQKKIWIGHGYTDNPKQRNER